METRAHYIMVGSFVIATLGALVIFILWMSKLDLGNKFKIYEIYFEGSVTGLRINEDVRYHGIPIGNVKQIKVDKKNINHMNQFKSVQNLISGKNHLIVEDIDGLYYTGYLRINHEGDKLNFNNIKIWNHETGWCI